MTMKRIYIQEDQQRVGPFASRPDAEQFIGLIRRFGEGTEGIEVVEVEEYTTEEQTSCAF